MRAEPIVAPSATATGSKTAPALGVFASGLRDPVFWVVTVLGALLLLSSLGSRCLWQDEAETGLLARAILRTGLPVTYDGHNLISQMRGQDSDAHHIWRWSPWLQEYVAAGALAVLGDSSFAIRLPFVLAALLSGPLTYWLTLELFGSLRVARLSALLLTVAVPFLLESRQARSYGLAFPCVPLLMLSLCWMARGQRRGFIGLVAAVTLLFYDNYFVAIGLGITLPAVALACSPRWQFLKRLTLALALSAVLVLPGVLYFLLYNQALGEQSPFSWVRVLASLKVYSYYYVTYLLPLPIVVLLVYLVVRRKEPELAGERWRWAVSLLGGTVLFSLYLCVAPWQNIRYQMLLLPLSAILLALTVAWLWRLRPSVGLAVLVLLIGTNLLHRFPVYYLVTPAQPAKDARPLAYYVSSPIGLFLYELTHPIDNSALAVAEHLRRHAQKDDVVLATYDDLTLQYYTPLRVIGGLQGPPAEAPVHGGPDWIWVRPGYTDDRAGGDGELWLALRRWAIDTGDPQAAKTQTHGEPGSWATVIETWPDAKRYEPVFLREKDLFLANDADPRHHRFWEPANVRRILLLHRVR